MFLDNDDSPIVNRCMDHTLSLSIKSLVKYGFTAIDEKIAANGGAKDNFFKTRFDAITEFLKMADTAQSDRPDWCAKSLNILASTVTPSDDDKHFIGRLLNDNYQETKN